MCVWLGQSIAQQTRPSTSVHLGEYMLRKMQFGRRLTICVGHGGEHKAEGVYDGL